MNLDKTEGRNDCADEGHQQFNRPTDRISSGVKWRLLVKSCGGGME
jgi:hypothetical protein